MRQIEILDDVRLRFPNRHDEFTVGVEVGAVAVLLALGDLPFQRRLSIEAINQLRPIAEFFGCSLVAVSDGSSTSQAIFASKALRPVLRVV